MRHSAAAPRAAEGRARTSSCAPSASWRPSRRRSSGRATSSSGSRRRRRRWSRHSRTSSPRRWSGRWTSSRRCKSCWRGAATSSRTWSRQRKGRRTIEPSRWWPGSRNRWSDAEADARSRTPSRRPRGRRSRRSRTPPERLAMHLKSITLKGFKSFPDRTRLEFGPGVSVIVGPNGSGKSNVTDAVLWAMGEQSPLAVRGQSMQDVIFAGGRGVQARSSAEVELVIDNGDGAIDLPMGEISILRRLDRSGDGEYRLNGAKCRLVDVLEVLSDTGLGKESHSVVSQGRVEAIVTSKPRDRRLLIEEAAGLGKHRKRRRRAQLKLERTQENLDRALDVEREARARLRPLKRQAEAAELHERLERQTDEARWTLAGEDARAARGSEREALAGRAFAARSSAERIGLRLEAARTAVSTIDDRSRRRRARLAGLEAE